jgi:hypothetical protein
MVLASWGIRSLLSFQVWFSFPRSSVGMQFLALPRHVSIIVYTATQELFAVQRAGDAFPRSEIVQVFTCGRRITIL